jgi:predicted SAM-dependent methyltransferase
MLINGFLYKRFRCPTAGLKVHLGPGQRDYLRGWLNVDANIISAKLDLWADLRNPLPFREGSVEIFYSHHVIEHLADVTMVEHLRQMFQALRSGGGIRIGGPHAGNACRKYLAGDLSWFPPFPQQRESIGGRFANFVFCAGEHLTALDETYLAENATKVGFTDIRFCKPGVDTCLSDLGIDDVVLSSELENDYEFPHTVIMEARKP